MVHPVGIDYHPPSQSLLVSYNFASGEPYNFARMYTNGSSATLFVTNWSGVHGESDEIKLAVVKETANGFTMGDMYFANGIAGGIGWLSADGATSNLNWITLTSEPNHFRGSLCLDQSGSFGGDLIGVTGENFKTLGQSVWRINSQGIASLLATIPAFHLEGIITLTNDVEKWGPWAGKAITGDETESPPPIYAIDPNGTVTTHFLGIGSEDFDIIPANQNLYCTDEDHQTILKVPSLFFTNYVGDLLITQSGDGQPGASPALFIVHWENSTTNFIITPILHPGGRFEHMTFAPIDLPNQIP
jgi:hypothetical protein